MLRDVVETDIPIFFEHQRDPEATQMALFPAREREAFTAHWHKILGEKNVGTKAIVFEGEVAGNIVSFERAGKRLVGYWIGREYWGKGIATQALAEFLDVLTERPLYAEVAMTNVGSIRVVEKCGFTLSGRTTEHDEAFGDVELGVWVLEA